MQNYLTISDILYCLFTKKNRIVFPFSRYSYFPATSYVLTITFGKHVITRTNNVPHKTPYPQEVFENYTEIMFILDHCFSKCTTKNQLIWYT